MILSIAMMLRFLGDDENATRIEAAVEHEVAARDEISVTTAAVGDRVAQAVQ